MSDVPTLFRSWRLVLYFTLYAK